MTAPTGPRPGDPTTPRHVAPPASLPVPRDLAARRGAGGLMGAALDLTAQLDLDALLTHFVDRAARLTGARFAALGVLDSHGDTAIFVHTGMSDGEARLLRNPPRGHGVFALIPADGHIILDDLTQHPAFHGFPPGHPPMQGFLGVPLRIREQVFGRLYLTDKAGGFTADDAETVRALADAASVAVENSRLYSAARTRERWLGASQDITTALLEGTEEEEALEMIASRVREVAEADTALIILPSVGSAWACEIADGARAADLLGVVFPPEGRAMTVLREGVGVMVDSLARSPVLRVDQLHPFGPALYAPMMLRGSGTGVLLLLRLAGGPEFVEEDLVMAESLAAQAALALELASARHAADVAALLDERARIGRDLHDLAIQQLFATGMELETARAAIAAATAGEGGDEPAGDDSAAAANAAPPVDLPAIVRLLETALASVDDSVTQIRGIVHGLREPDAAVDLVERLRREASLARTSLGYAPSLLVSVDGRLLDDADEDEDRLMDAVAHRVDADISDDVVAVVREGLSNAARHARAASVQVSVDVTGMGPTGSVRVSVADDGIGVDPSRTRRSGLANLAVRARRHGGTFALHPHESGRGTVMQWAAPLT